MPDPALPDDPPRAWSAAAARRLSRGLLLGVALCLSLFVLRTYRHVHNGPHGWTELIRFGRNYAPVSLPRLQRLAPYAPPAPDAGFGYDGQYYAQMALDPSLRDPAFDHALDNPAYRARRILLPALAYGLGGGKPRRVIQAYAVGNLLFWFVLLGTLAVLFRPWEGQQLLGLGAAMLGCGVIASMKWALTDLPAATLILVGAALGSWGGHAAFAAAALTRETSVLAVVGCLDPRGPWDRAAWQRRAGRLAVALVPLAGWTAYVGWRFRGEPRMAGAGNFAWPGQAMGARLADGVRLCLHDGLGEAARAAGGMGWLYADFNVNQVLVAAALAFQGLYLLLRWDVRSEFWRMGMCFLALGSVLGPAVWSNTEAAARVLIPLTLCFYLRLARERAVWFWPFFILGSLSVPYAVHDFWWLN